MLTASELAAAVAFNHANPAKLTAAEEAVLWSGVKGSEPQCWDEQALAHARRVARFQSTHGLTVDGKLGPKTLAVLRAKAAPKFPEGIDVSGWNPERLFDWPTLATAGQSFAYVKVGGGEGKGYTSKAAHWQVDRFLHLGWAVGPYYFCDVSEDPVKEAERFFELRNAVFKGRPSLAMAPDLEWFDEHNHLPDAHFRRWLVLHVARLRTLDGREPALYIGPNFWKEHLGGPLPELGPVHLWTIDYSKPDEPPALPPGFTTWTFRQWTGSGKLPGYKGEKLDRNVFNGTEAELRRMAR